MKYLLASLFAFSVAGCASPGFDAAHQAIINGVLSEADDDAAIGLAILSTGGQFQGACSGVLVAPNLVLTARHCVSRTEEGSIACNSDGTPRAGGGVLGDYKPTQLKVLLGTSVSFDFPATGMQILHPDVTNLCDNDIAMLVLDTALPNAPFAQLRRDHPPAVDDTIRAVGWGTSNNSQNITRRKRDDIAIIDVGPNTFDGLGDREFAIGEGICSGDSGGPAFDEVTKAVIGLVSRGGNGAPYNPQSDPQYTPCVDSAQYHTNNIYTRTDGFADFIMSGFAAAGAEPWLEGGPDPRLAKFGTACTAATECRSAICAQGMCSQACDTTFCPDGFSCIVADGASVCGAPPKKNGCASVPGSPSAGGGALFLLAIAAVLVRAARRRGQEARRI